LILADERPQVLHPRHSELLTTLAHQIALAIHHAQLYARMEEMVVVEERYRLSREFHDGLAQTLSYLTFLTDNLQELMDAQQLEAAKSEIGEIRQTLRSAYVDVREAIDGLRTRNDEPGALGEQLRDYVVAFARQTGLEPQLEITPSDFYTTPICALQLMRIAQEALSNVRKHAEAQHVYLSLQQCNDQLCLSIADDGKGFSLEDNTGRSRHYGLSSIRERAASLGGSVTIATRPQHGTRITVTIPDPNST